jgi:uncharacterized coiled-coil protein SlyX
MTPSYVQTLPVAAIVGILALGFHPGISVADDASRISTLESTIQQLKTRVEEQERRIERLEADLDRLSGEPHIKAIPRPREENAAPPATGKQPWHSPEPWARVSKGMTREQVTEILGQPTAVESMDGYATLFYRLGSLNGLVNLRDNHVVAVNKPSFGG